MNPASDFARAAEYLVSLKRRGVSLGLDRMRAFVARLGNPQLAVPCVHVAGTNGKGSVAAMLESILRTAGWRTGLYTSPHLVRLGERIQVNREPLADSAIARSADELRAVAETLPPAEQPSYFEFMTAMAFVHFARAKCDIAIIEVGLGGRLDATNVVIPEASVITSIGLDHTELLGPTLDHVAREKAGIIKRGVPVIIGRLPPSADAVIRETAAALGAPLSSVADAFGSNPARYPRTNLEGDYQSLNAATATLAASALGSRWQLDAGTVRRGLANVSWPGRWERRHLGGRLIILDTSHNVEGATALEANLGRLVQETGRAPLVVTGVLGRSRAKPIIEAISRHAAEIRFVEPNQSRACRYDELAALVPPSFQGHIGPARVPDFRALCTSGDPAQSIVVTGSIYLVGEIIAELEARRAESELQDF